MSTYRTQTRSSRTITTGKALTAPIRKSIKALTKSSTPAKTTVKRLQTLLTTFRARVSKLAKSNSNGRKRH